MIEEKCQESELTVARESKIANAIVVLYLIASFDAWIFFLFYALTQGFLPVVELLTSSMSFVGLIRSNIDRA